MPALITHRLFGEESIDRLPAGIITTDEERIAFLLANQGPDPFFFRVRTLELGDCMKLAQQMHKCRMSAQFEAIRDGVSRLNKADAGVGRAFALGLLSHYALDRNAHPFVYDQQWGIIDAEPSLAKQGSSVHAVIESDLDVLMLQLKRDGATCADYPPAGEIVTTDRIDKVAGALMSHVATKVYRLKVVASEYAGAVRDMKLLYKAIEPAGSPLTHAHSMLSGLAHPVTETMPLSAGNMARNSWTNPFTQEPSRASFPEIFDFALDDYAQIAAQFVQGADLADITCHVNYSGRPLGDAEEFEGEE